MMDEQITLKKLEIFAVFMHVENIGKAAEILKMSSVSVHRALHSLEEGAAQTQQETRGWGEALPRKLNLQSSKPPSK